MENKYTSPNTYAPAQREPGIMLLDLRNFIESLIAQPLPILRPRDKPQRQQDNLDYLLAISG